LQFAQSLESFQRFFCFRGVAAIHVSILLAVRKFALSSQTQLTAMCSHSLWPTDTLSAELPSSETSFGLLKNCPDAKKTVCTL
jgi:hypothetical protein